MDSAVRVARTRKWGIVDAAVGTVAATILVLLLSAAALRGWPQDPRLSEVLSYLVVWVPLLGTVLIASWWRGAKSLVIDFGFTFRPLDLLWGLTVGVLARLLAGILEIAGYGRLGSAGATFGEPVRDLWWVFAALLAPVLIGPVIEELFFRGLLARAVADSARSNGGSRRTAIALAIVVSGLVFALVHILTVSTPTAAMVIGVSTFVFGAAAAALSQLTGRLGGAVVAHITFNALVIVPALVG
ncbi:MAG: CPBP family intramembrane glutamic endopeptidase [Cryobacterium sp.]